MGCGALAAVISIKSLVHWWGVEGEWFLSPHHHHSRSAIRLLGWLRHVSVVTASKWRMRARPPWSMRGIWRRQSADQTVISSFFLCPFYLSRHVSFFFFLLQKGYCIATYTYSADWPSQVAISGTEAVIFYPFVTLLTLFFFATCRCNSSADRRADGIPSVAIHWPNLSPCLANWGTRTGG